MGWLERLIPPAGRDKFAARMTRALRKAGETQPIEYDKGDFRLLIGDGKDAFQMFLVNAHRDYSAAPLRERGNVIRRYAQIRSATPDDEPDFATARKMLLPRVRERYYHESLKLLWRRQDSKGVDLAVRPLNEYLTIELVLDYPDAVKSVSAGDLRDWGVGFDEAMAVARDNLWSLSNDNFLPLGPGTYVSPWRDTHDCSRLYLHDLVWQLEVKGAHVAFVPNREVLIVTGSDDAEGLSRAGALAEEALNQTRAMTGIAFRLDGANWAPFLPSADSPAYGPLKRLAMRSILMDYTEQAEALNALADKEGEDVFVAGHRVVERDDGSWFSWAVWVESVDNALMPEADFISFGGAAQKDGSPGKSYGWADWATVRRVCGELMEPTDLYPPRYRVRRFPTAEQLAQLNLREKA
jgi:hypothetical protein